MPVPPNTLSGMPLFEPLAQHDRAQLRMLADEIVVARGTCLYQYGHAVQHFYVIKQGIVQVFRTTPAGHEVTSDLLGPGDSVNIDDVVASRQNHHANARAVDDVRVLRIPILWMRTALDLTPQILGMLTERLDRRHNEAEQRATLSSAQLVACQLQELCATHGFDPSGFDLPHSKALIASRLHIEPETFSRTLKCLRGHGIAVTGSHVRFTDIETVDRFACAHCPTADNCRTRSVFERHRATNRMALLPEKAI